MLTIKILHAYYGTIEALERSWTFEVRRGKYAQLSVRTEREKNTAQINFRCS